LAQFASAALAAHCVKITALPVSKLADESAPLSAAWQRLQRLRSGVNNPTTAPAAHTAEPTSTLRSVFTQTVVHQRKTHSAHIEWTPAPMPALILPR
jgi:hypothetical protein